MRALLVVAMVAAGAIPARAETFYVAKAGSNGAPGSAARPWRTLQHAADKLRPGDKVIVRPGQYAGFYVGHGGEAGKPIVYAAEPGVIVNRDARGATDAIALEGVAHVVIEGFTVTMATRAGIRALHCQHVTLRGNRAIANGKWGIFTGFCDDLVVEDNECALSGREHGIYLSNSGDRPQVRRNVLHHNRICGLHMNGDISMGGDGIISDAVVEGNVVYENGAAGGSAINCDGVQSSLFQNNLLYDNHASGISLYRIDGGAGATDNLLVNNTIIVADDGRWAVNIQDGSSGNTLRNNILVNRRPDRGAIDISPDSLPGLSSDYNVVTDRLTRDDAATVMSLAEWAAATGNDKNSVTAELDQLFASGGKYRLAAASPAIDRGSPERAPGSDIFANQRPVGAGIDIGAEERCAAEACARADSSPPPGELLTSAAEGTAPAAPVLPAREEPRLGCGGCSATGSYPALAILPLLLAGWLLRRRTRTT